MIQNPLLKHGSVHDHYSLDDPENRSKSWCPSNIEGISMYQLYPESSKNAMLWAGGFIALLTPFTDTVYLPALDSIVTSLNTSDSLVNATVSCYLFSAAIGQLVWGTLSDHYGRQKILYFGLFCYELVTIGCIFANDIYVLIALRSVEGFLVGSSLGMFQSVCGHCVLYI